MSFSYKWRLRGTRTEIFPRLPSLTCCKKGLKRSKRICSVLLVPFSHQRRHELYIVPFTHLRYCADETLFFVRGPKNRSFFYLGLNRTVPERWVKSRFPGSPSDYEIWEGGIGRVTEREFPVLGVVSVHTDPHIKILTVTTQGNPV